MTGEEKCTMSGAYGPYVVARLDTSDQLISTYFWEWMTGGAIDAPDVLPAGSVSNDRYGTLIINFVER